MHHYIKKLSCWGGTFNFLRARKTTVLDTCGFVSLRWSCYGSMCLRRRFDSMWLLHSFSSLSFLFSLSSHCFALMVSSLERKGMFLFFISILVLSFSNIWKIKNPNYFFCKIKYQPKVKIYFETVRTPYK